MSTLSVPLTRELEKFVDSMVKSGEASNKADVVRKALRKYAEDQAVEAVLRAEQEAREGKVFKGDLRKLLKKI
jgi:putative addiction module CopG family antidote